jgi:acyl-CoA synthetase (AMP-forming)/AMP-acid ligase II
MPANRPTAIGRTSRDKRVSLADSIQGVVALDPYAPELEFERQWCTWGQLREGAAGLAAALDELALGEGARVGALLRNDPHFVPLLIALFSTHRCLATLNAHAPDAALAADIERVQVPVVVGLGRDLARPAVRAALARSGTAALRFTGDMSHPVVPDPDLAGHRGLWSRATAPGIAVEMLSSGTTGTPKRIPLPYRNFESALLGAAAFEKGRRAGDGPRLRSGVQVVSAPMAHIAGVTAVMNNILAGRRICLLARFTVEGFRDAVVRHRPKVAGAPPSALKMIMDADIPAEDFASLLAYRAGTAPLDSALADAFYERYGIPVLQNYGATEFAGGVAGWTLEDFKAHWRDKHGSVGRLNKGVEARVVDPDTGEPLAPGRGGLLEMRGDNIGDGASFVRTTDLAVVDDDGFLFIRGRHDNAIIRGGFKILPTELVEVLEQHPAIREAAVVGIDDARLGQVPAAAYIVGASASPPGQAELREYLRERLLPYQVPVVLLAVDDLPRTPSMKVSQPALVALLKERMRIVAAQQAQQ